MSWTEENIEQLRQLWDSGKTASEIVTALNIPGLTRNAVCGVIDRHGMSRPKAPGQSPRARQRRAAKANPTPRAARPPSPAPARPEPIRKEVMPNARSASHARIDTLSPIVNPQSGAQSPKDGVSIAEIKEWSCHWVLGDVVDARYCGATKKPGSSYCAHHFAISLAPARPRTG